MIDRFTRSMKNIVDNPYLNIIVGLLFLYSGFQEAVDHYKEAEEIKIGAHHGVILFSMLYILKALPDVVEGLERVIQAREKHMR